MIQSLRRAIDIYTAIAAMTMKVYMAYGLWVWAQFVVQIISMFILVYFWRAVYAGTATLGGLDLQQTLNYILLATIISPLLETRSIFQFGFMLRNGSIAVQLVMPLDFELRQYVEALANLLLFAIQKVPLVLVAWVFFGLQLSADPFAWGAFSISLLFGQTVLFFFDWIFACFAFYSTETWGLSVLRVGVGIFFSGALVPLTIMPEGVRAIANALPFAQALYVPVSILSGITPLAMVPYTWAVQIIWLLALGLVSRWVFGVAVRQVTVQGG